MEADRDSIREARATFAREIAGLKATVRKSGQRLAELERGRRIAQAAEVGAAAEGRLGARRSERQRPRSPMPRRRCAACASGRPRMPPPTNAYEALDNEPNPAGNRGPLEAAGFGKRTRPTAAERARAPEAENRRSRAGRLNLNLTKPH